ncbi:MAG: glycoside hydrolase family 3 N-terminal domain-containing protein [Christensenella sp.]|uniref:glycoside hydrolase family 3 N-terminal domain-containing protein n=1 Tax=Christensenella sp. TaxID=1935934 RepID=UPI002B1F7CF9|nr:glycoside hydrolase family 3 N-terminal domain-containing protein [Christensenella sp.]MEA5003763.1 glycoside hydrolase family 3 N-terminal domain-containing protein [Christensenella sp.]
MKTKSIVAILLCSLLLFGACAAPTSPQAVPTQVVSTEDVVVPPEASAGMQPTPEPSESAAEPVTEEAPVLDFSLYEDRAKEILADMTTQEKAAQMFFARCPETDAAELQKQFQFGGYILFKRDFEDKTKADVQDNIESYQDAAKIPMLIGVDEEGGSVTRLSRFEAFRDEPFLSPQELYEQGGFARITEDTQEKAALLKGLGINVNLSPVCDVSTDPDDFIYPRAFGKDAQQTSEYVSTVITAMNESGMGSVMKHYPGYGSNTDTHTGIAHDTRSLDTFTNSDFLPFLAGMQAGAPGVLVNHNIVESMDKENPASLSGKVHEILREEQGFLGVIMTDDLYMDAIKDEYGAGKAAVLAVLAGNDMLISSQPEEQLGGVLDALEEGTIEKETIDAAVTRVLCWKLSLGLME